MSSRLEKSIFVIILIVSLVLVNIQIHIQNVFSQSGEDISITVANSSFAPMTNVHGSQAKVSITYQVNDESLENEKINGIMSIYTPNGTLVHHSSFPDGFEAKKKGGTVDFKTTIRDPNIQDLIANVSLTDLDRGDVLSNTVKTNLTLVGSPAPISTTSQEEEE